MVAFVTFTLVFFSLWKRSLGGKKGWVAHIKKKSNLFVLPG